jgi:hypothetical protein
MVNSYLHRIEAIEERLGIRECPKGPLCFKCEMAKLHAELHGGDWGGCDAMPSRFVDWPREDQTDQAIGELTEAALDQLIADLEILAARQPDNAKLSSQA